MKYVEACLDVGPRIQPRMAQYMSVRLCFSNARQATVPRCLSVKRLRLLVLQRPPELSHCNKTGNCFLGSTASEALRESARLAKSFL